MLAQLDEEAPTSPELSRGVAWLMQDQHEDGSWFGRWGMNYIYGTWSALSALNAAGVDPQSPTVRKAVDWLIRIQNADGGWGEDGSSYKLDYQGYEPAPSTPSQTAWALLGLMAAGEVEHPAVARGIAYLARKPGARTACGRRTASPRLGFRASSICAITATRSSSRSGRWPATATCGGATAGPSPTACRGAT